MSRNEPDDHDVSPEDGSSNDASPVRRLPADLILRSRPNWTAVVFIALLAALHLAVAVPAFLHKVWEGYLSMGLGVLFAAAAGAVATVRSEVAVLPAERRVAVRTRLPGWRIERGLPFARVLAVRLTLMPGGGEESKVEILAADGGDVECPPTAVPRQEALLLAMVMNVPLIRVSECDEDAGGVGTGADPRGTADRSATRWTAQE